MSSPAWLTREYLERALREYYSDEQLCIVDYLVKPALGKGENYGATLTRIKVIYERSGDKVQHERYLIAKSRIEEQDELTREKKSGYQTNKCEMSIFENVHPKLNELLNEIHDEEQIFPETIFVDKQNMAIIFEDLNERGFRMADRVKRLDSAHVQLILRKLAKMHATSAVLNERESGCLEVFDRGFFNRYTDGFRNYFVGCLEACARWLATLPSYKKYAEKLFMLASTFMEIGVRCVEATSGHINVLIHGDLWTNNVMFKYDESTGEPIDALILDYEYSFWGSPALDLHFVANNSWTEELRYWDESDLIPYYHEIFVDTLKKLNYKQNPLPSLHEFRVQAEQKRFYGLVSAIIFQPLMLNEDPTDSGCEILLTDDERAMKYKDRLFLQPVIQEILLKLIPIYDRLGLLDANQ